MITPHLDKINAALNNPLVQKNKQDFLVMKEILKIYKIWTKQMDNLKTTGNDKVKEMIKLLNEYKDTVEVNLILEKGSEFLVRQKGQLKLDNTIVEEFLPKLLDPKIIPELKNVNFQTGPQKTFMSLSFQPRKFAELDGPPIINIKTKDQDFTLGKELYYKFSSDKVFTDRKTTSGKIMFAILAAECKINLDKTMFQEAAGTATRFKIGVPYSKYYILAEYLDMTPEDPRLTDIDNVFLLRHAKRLPFELRKNLEAVKQQRKDYPIDYKIIEEFINEIKSFLSVDWYDPEKALEEGKFI